MPMRLLLFAFVAGGNALTLNRIQSVAKLLRCGDFEHLARSFDDDALVLHLPHNQRVVTIHESRVDLAKQACGAKCLADRVGGGAAAPGLTRQRDGDAWRTARARANEALAGAAAKQRCRELALVAAREELANDAPNNYGLRTARAALRAVLFGGDDALATAFLGPRGFGGSAPPAKKASRARGRLRVARFQGRALAAGDFFRTVDAFTNVDAKVERARAAKPRPLPAEARAFMVRTREAAIAAARADLSVASPLVAGLLGDGLLDDADVAAALNDLILAGTATTAELVEEALRLRDDGDADGDALVARAIDRRRDARAVAPLLFRVAAAPGRLGPVALEPGDGVVASLRVAPDLAFGAGKRACAGRDVALAVAAAAVDARLEA